MAEPRLTPDCAAKKMKDSLSSFLPGLPGMVDLTSQQDNSSLRQLIEKPPVGGKELMLLNQLQLAGFRYKLSGFENWVDLIPGQAASRAPAGAVPYSPQPDANQGEEE